MRGCSKRSVLAAISVLEGTSPNEALAKWSVPETSLRECLSELEKGASLSGSSQMEVAIYLALELGSTAEEIARALSWRGFEKLVGRILEENDFRVLFNVRTKSRKEIDVVGVKGSYGISIDCKHWSRPLSRRDKESIAALQRDRTEELSISLGIKLYPIVVTLRGIVDEISGVTFLPVNALRDFLMRLGPPS